MMCEEGTSLTAMGLAWHRWPKALVGTGDIDCVLQEWAVKGREPSPGRLTLTTCVKTAE